MSVPANDPPLYRPIQPTPEQEAQADLVFERLKPAADPSAPDVPADPSAPAMP